MGGYHSFSNVTQESLTAPWSVHKTPSLRVSTVFRPLWKELPWHLEHPALFAFIAGTLVTAALWLLTSI